MSFNAIRIFPSRHRGFGRCGAIDRAPARRCRELPFLGCKQGRESRSQACEMERVGAGVGHKRAMGEQKARTPLNRCKR